ncbi:uncharacterized protein N7479_002039 [Penicillium vulpinum]|uniref:uncharacterized protein n=1 Tax=Penicillium vulpinum TaxID=29845 RepID=UPI0025479D56|nr:uncharacterized protein N7479_002039 [Penicillium vulpinum]KAJ5972121.1 hypothetical protein N7479_002039 [Penicillium vulpinum]
MKASFIATVAALVGSAFAAPTPVGGLDGLLNGLKVGDITKELKLNEIPVVSKLGDLTNVLNLPTSPSASSAPAVQDGHLVQNLGPQLDNILTVVGPDATTLLIELSPEVSALVSGLGLGALGAPLGFIVASASGLGDLVTGLGPVVDGLVTVVGADVGALLISLSPEVAGIVSGLGLPSVGVPVGTVVATLGKNIKRGEIVQDLAPKVKTTLTAADLGDLVKDISEPVKDLLYIVAKDGKSLLIKLSPSVIGLVIGLGLPTVATPLGDILTTVAQNL